MIVLFLLQRLNKQYMRKYNVDIIHHFYPLNTIVKMGLVNTERYSIHRAKLTWSMTWLNGNFEPGHNTKEQKDEILHKAI